MSKPEPRVCECEHPQSEHIEGERRCLADPFCDCRNFSPVEVSEPPVAVGEFQSRVDPWLLACFGEQIARDKVERNHRFLEESLELVQALGCTQPEAHQLVDYTFNRPVGHASQEVGGVMVTLAALCLASGLDMHEAGEVELARIWTKIGTIRAKQAAKPRHSPLPESTTKSEDVSPKAEIATIKTSNSGVRYAEPDEVVAGVLKRARDNATEIATHEFDPIDSSQTECECGLLRDADVHRVTEKCVHGLLLTKPCAECYREAGSPIAYNDSDAHALSCKRWFQYDENHKRYIPDQVCTCGAADRAVEPPTDSPSMRAAKRWFHEVRVGIEANRIRTGGSFADNALAHTTRAEQNLAAIIDSELGNEATGG